MRLLILSILALSMLACDSLTGAEAEYGDVFPMTLNQTWVYDYSFEQGYFLFGGRTEGQLTWEVVDIGPAEPRFGTDAILYIIQERFEGIRTGRRPNDFWEYVDIDPEPVAWESRLLVIERDNVLAFTDEPNGSDYYPYELHMPDRMQRYTSPRTDTVRVDESQHITGYDYRVRMVPGEGLVSYKRSAGHKQYFETVELTLVKEASSLPAY
ncbi:MAG: hypothetical protein AAGJ10_14795 [Bacteroidota bacterium]